MKRGRQLRLLWKIVKRTHLDRFVYSFLFSLCISAFIICLVEPGIATYGEALWYIIVASTTIGFGDFVAVTLIGKLVTIFMVLSEVILVAIVPGIVVSYYMEVVQLRKQETVTLFLDKLEHLPELSKEELTEIAENVKQLKN